MSCRACARFSLADDVLLTGYALRPPGSKSPTTTNEWIGFVAVLNRIPNNCIRPEPDDWKIRGMLWSADSCQVCRYDVLFGDKDVRIHRLDGDHYLFNRLYKRLRSVCAVEWWAAALPQVPLVAATDLDSLSCASDPCVIPDFVGAMLESDVVGARTEGAAILLEIMNDCASTIASNPDLINRLVLQLFRAPMSPKTMYAAAKIIQKWQQHQSANTALPDAWRIAIRTVLRTNGDDLEPAFDPIEWIVPKRELDKLL